MRVMVCGVVATWCRIQLDSVEYCGVHARIHCIYFVLICVLVRCNKTGNNSTILVQHMHAQQ